MKQYKIGDKIKYKKECTGGLLELEGTITALNYGGNAVQVYHDTPSSTGWTRVPYENIIE